MSESVKRSTSVEVEKSGEERETVTIAFFKLQ